MRPPSGMGRGLNPIEQERRDHPPMLMDHEGNVRPRYQVGAGVGALIRNQAGGILLIKRGPECSHGAGTWSVPGGWMEYGETPAEAVEREVLEEVGITVFANSGSVYVATSTVFEESGVHSVCLWVPCEITGVTFEDIDLSRLTLEPGKVEEARWVSLSEARTIPLFGHFDLWLNGKGAFG